MSNKNVFLVPTMLNSNIAYVSYFKGDVLEFFTNRTSISPSTKPMYMYIVDNEPIQKKDWAISVIEHEVYLCKQPLVTEGDKRIVLTNDPNLINSGVQQIDNDFLRQYVKTPCDYVNVETKYYMPQRNGQIVDFPIAFELSLDPKDNILPFHKATFIKDDTQHLLSSENNKKRLMESVETEGNMITEWLDKYGKPEIDAQVEREAEALMNKEKDEEMIQFLLFVQKKYIRVKGYYYLKGDYEKKHKISDPRELLKIFKNQ